ncbi:MAG: tyrosine--tRNA ligase, partial [Clostridiales bacterium]|nr:tyrosine--tRNA ligase [Clostridiales bacterium]
MELEGKERKSVEEQLRIISKGAAEIIGIEDLERKLRDSLKTGRQLVVKLGLDPSAPDIHLGHTVVLRKIKQFQELGHKAVIIIGDFTGMIGDPTGKSKARKQLDRAKVMENAQTYTKQIFKILDMNMTEVRFNSEWLSKLYFEDVVRLASKCTVSGMLERKDFSSRFEKHESIGIHEFFYPLMQAYDSVAIKADVELGGTEQRFNILMGRVLQKDYGQESQAAVFMPLLEGTDGVEKMSKSLGNYIGIDEEAVDVFGKVMSIPDNLILRYFELATDVHPDRLDEMAKQLETVNPMDVKLELAREITALYHGRAASDAAEIRFRRVFQQKGLPELIKEFSVEPDMLENESVNLPKLIYKAHLAAGTGEARRIMAQGGVRING